MIPVEVPLKSPEWIIISFFHDSGPPKILNPKILQLGFEIKMVLQHFEKVPQKLIKRPISIHQNVF